MYMRLNKGFSCCITFHTAIKMLYFALSTNLDTFTSYSYNFWRKKVKAYTFKTHYFPVKVHKGKKRCIVWYVVTRDISLPLDFKKKIFMGFQGACDFLLQRHYLENIIITCNFSYIVI